MRGKSEACCDIISLWIGGAYQATTRQNTKVIQGKLGRCSGLYWENWVDVLGNGVGEGKERPAHAVGECVEQDPEQEHLRIEDFTDKDMKH